MAELLNQVSRALPLVPTILLVALAIILGAAIVVVATRFAANVLAGFALGLARRGRPGDLVRIGDRFGRVIDRGLLASEVQTEDHDVVTVPHLARAYSPLPAVRSAGVLVAADISLGREVPRDRAEKLLRAAAEVAGLADPRVLVLTIDDRAVIYRVAGSLADLERLLGARSRLREAVLDQLQGREVATDAADAAAAPASGSPVERFALDEFTDTATIDELRRAHERTRAGIARLADPPADLDPAEARRRQEALARQLARIEKLIAARQAAAPARQRD